MKFIRTDVTALSCEGVRAVKVGRCSASRYPALPAGFTVTITYEQGDQLEVRVDAPATDLTDDMARYVQTHLLNRIMSFLSKGDNESAGGYTIPANNSFNLEEAVYDIIKRFECTEEEA